MRPAIAIAIALGIVLAVLLLYALQACAVTIRIDSSPGAQVCGLYCPGAASAPVPAASGLLQRLKRDEP